MWIVQQVEDEQTPFLLYNGVLVARLYGGCPISAMLLRLNLDLTNAASIREVAELDAAQQERHKRGGQ